MDETHPTVPGRLPTYRPPQGEFHVVLPEDLAAQAAKAEQEGDGAGPPVRARQGTKPVWICGIECRR